MEKIRAGIIGGAGYTGGELIRLLINHPNVEIAFVHSNSNANKDVVTVHKDLLGDTDLTFTDQPELDVDVLFLCVGHGHALKFLTANFVGANVKIIDLSQDFRLFANAVNGEREFVYGLPELNRAAIQSANNIANPGCFATAIQLALLPLAAEGLLKSEVHINATTGSTGAGQGLSPTAHFSWRSNNLSVYKVFEHQHLNEIGQTLAGLQPGFSTNTLRFIPQRGSFARGIFATAYLQCNLDQEEASELYQSYYRSHLFTHLSEAELDLKQVVNTNKCFIHLKKHQETLVISSAIDNLLKGASGQAVQNMNLMFGLNENSGLLLKASAF